jgi:F-type H+-transporting ATPase subunit a
VGGDAVAGKELMEHTPFTWLGLLPYPEPVLTAVLVAGLLVIFAASVHRQLAATEAAIQPDDGVTARNLAEAFVEAIAGLTEGVIGHDSTRYVPLLASFFIFVLVANLIGLVPGFMPPTSDFNITFGLGVVSFAAYHFYGAREHGFGYIKQFLGSVVFLYPLMLVVEVFSHLFRPVSLGIRLFANMFADHKVVEIFSDLTYVIPVVFYVLGAFVGVVQAFVFTMLSAIYIALAVSHDH